MNADEKNDELTMRPIGYVRTQKSLKFEALHQPDEEIEEQSVLELLPGEEYRRALQDVEGFSRIWLIWWFHRNSSWRSLVLPPRGPAHRRGVFATRSPHRPNPLGITPVKLLSIKGNQLFLGACDLVDGTPVFDIKPYIPQYDAFPDESAGWLDEVDAWMKLEPSYQVLYSTLATAQKTWLSEQWAIHFSVRMEELLERDPTPHRTRRIRRRKSGLHEIGCGAWRAVFNIVGKQVIIDSIEPGFPLRLLCGEYSQEIPDCDAQRDYLTIWPAAEVAD
jgi:tRNA-Thr(GGU) m(6)t(6)A37 methyltransferase TsaA